VPDFIRSAANRKPEGFSFLMATGCLDCLRDWLKLKRTTSVNRDKIAMAIMAGLALIALLAGITMSSMPKWG